MWCTHCQTPFHWKTLKIIQGDIHNPHFYEWQRNPNNQSNHLQVDTCDQNELPNITRLRNQIAQTHSSLEPSLIRMIFDWHRNILHLQNIEMEHLVPDPTESDLFQRNLEYRKQYLLKELNEDKFKNLLAIKENKMERRKCLYQIYEMVVQTMILFFHEFFILTQEDVQTEWRSKINRLLEYANSQLKNYSHRFNVRPISFSNSFSIMR
jgi:hypothetical protein